MKRYLRSSCDGLRWIITNAWLIDDAHNDTPIEGGIRTDSSSSHIIAINLHNTITFRVEHDLKFDYTLDYAWHPTSAQVNSDCLIEESNALA